MYSAPHPGASWITCRKQREEGTHDRYRAFERWFAPAVSRRTVLRGGLLGGVGLAAAALIGCGGDDDDDDGGSDASTGSSSTTGTTSSGSTSSGGASGGSTTTSTTGGDEPGEGMLVRDPDLPFPYQFPEPGGLTPKAGGVMNIAATFSIATMDPTKSAAGGTITVPNMVYNRILGMVGGPRKNPYTIELEPELAASWSARRTASPSPSTCATT